MLVEIPVETPHLDILENPMLSRYCTFPAVSTDCKVDLKYQFSLYEKEGVKFNTPLNNLKLVPMGSEWVIPFCIFLNSSRPPDPNNAVSVVFSTLLKFML